MHIYILYVCWYVRGGNDFDLHESCEGVANSKRRSPQCDLGALARLAEGVAPGL